MSDTVGELDEGSHPRDRRALTALQPSQSLVSERKFRVMLEWWDADDPTANLADDPLPYLHPVEDLGLDSGVVAADRVVLADGHTRALAAVLTGVESVPVVREPDRDGLSMDVYRPCVDWCLDEDFREPADLVGRVVSHERHLEEWVDRCRALADED